MSLPVSSTDITSLLVLSEDQQHDSRAFTVNAFKTALGPYDANVLLSRPPWVFTSPNLSDIPFVDVQPSQLCARADGRFGVEDYVQWPQTHSEAYPWAPCILRKPTADELEDHPHWFLWEDITSFDWVHPPGASWQQTGVLRDAWRGLLRNSMEPITSRALAAVCKGTLPSYVAIAVNSLQATLARLTDLPMSYRDLVLQFTQAQRLGLDLLAMEAYHGHMFSRMIQRKQIYPLQPEFMGCHTNNPTTVENMFYAGIPVVYIRSSLLITPSQLRVRRVVDTFAPVPADLITAHWPKNPCRVLHHGASSTRRFQMSRPHGRYFEDLIPLPDTVESVPDMRPFLLEDPLSTHSRLPCLPPEAEDTISEQDPVDDYMNGSWAANSPSPSVLPDVDASGSLVVRRDRSRYVRGGHPAKQARQPHSRSTRKQLEREYSVISVLISLHYLCTLCCQ